MSTKQRKGPFPGWRFQQLSTTETFLVEDPDILVDFRTPWYQPT